MFGKWVQSLRQGLILAQGVEKDSVIIYIIKSVFCDGAGALQLPLKP